MSTTDEPTVFVVDDDQGMRRSLSRLLRSEGIATETFVSAGDFLAKYDPRRPGCLVLDVRMGGMNGLELQALLARDRALTPVVMISGHADVRMVVRSMQAGACEFLEKPFEDEKLLDAIRSAFALDARTRSDDALRRDVLQSIGELTPRERDVLPHLLQGRHAKQLAVALGISPKTAHIHLGRVLKKLRVDNAVELGNLMHATGLFDELVATTSRPEELTSV